MFKKLLLSVSIIAISFICRAQNAETLQWKIKPGDSIVYNTVMKSNSDSNIKVQVPALFKALKDEKGGFDFQKQINELQKMQPDHYITTLKPNKSGVIDIEMTVPEEKKAKDTSQMGNLFQMMGKLAGGVMLRGAVYANGDIQSFYLRTDQRNLIALFFQLPTKSVKVGDSWQIGTNLISMDQNFKCDSSYKRNNVSVIAIDNVGTDKIVSIKYDIEEYVIGDFRFGGKLFSSEENGQKMSVKITHKAIGRFSVNKGRWISYDGEMATNNSGGLLNGYSKEQFSLIAQ